ncbi:speckle-type POZ protein-like [Argiope bruennichi]|uniref:speckle-type POZ protein-like n=1 Tax=Argiope bruennichi TaxID=94029 RepID=UPI0024954AFF|nr:speckle-type POZ protein-like [Argiope bruennichi]
MTENRECFTFIWKIKNFGFCDGRTDSPEFIAPIPFGKLQLSFFTNSKIYDDCVACYIDIKSKAPESLQCRLNCELSFLDCDESVLVEFVTVNVDALTAKREEFYLSKKDQFICNYTLTIRCRIWNSEESISCFGETRIETECKTYIGTIKEFDSINPTQKYPVCMDSSSNARSLFSFNLSVSASGKLDIEVSPTKSEITLRRIFNIFILDKCKDKVKCGLGKFLGEKPLRISLTISKDFLIKYREQYLPMNQLTILCEEIFAEGKTTKEIEYVFDSQDNQKVISEAKRTDISFEEYHSEDLTSLKDDLISMFRGSILCDTKIKTGNAIFPAHITVLSARSPVFKSMFTTDMKEKTNHCVDIDDLDDDTVSRMLLFMYSDSLDDLEYESAKNLYYAADKYNIVSLKHRCSNLLKQKILIPNCCDILFLAEKHQDNDLKRVAHDYITKNDEEVFFSDEWKNFEKDHPQLAIEVFRSVYIQKKK